MAGDHPRPPVRGHAGALRRRVRARLRGDRRDRGRSPARSRLTPWVESVSPSFRARHEDADAGEADRILDSLERTRDRTASHFPVTDPDLTVVIHRSRAALALARPVVPVAWALTAPPGRPYVAGWASAGELHVLRSGDECTAAALYVRQVIGQGLPRRLGRIRAELEWAWLLEGTARWFAGQTAHARAAIARRLRQGPRPSFPPGLRDAVLLGGTVVDLLAREEGEAAAAALARRLHPDGSAAALTLAFGGRPLRRSEEAWRSSLERFSRSARWPAT